MKRLLLLSLPLLLLATTARAETPATQPTTLPTSKSVEKNGLAVTVTLDKPAFASNENPRGGVHFKNVTGDKATTLSLFNPNAFYTWTFQFTNTNKDARTAGPWQSRRRIVPRIPDLPKTVWLKPNQVFDADFTLPRGDTEYVWAGLTERLIAPVAHLAPGTYQLVITIDLKENTTLDGNGLAKHWVGSITTEPVTFDITDQPLPHNLAPDAKKIFDALNAQIADKTWAAEADRYERPEANPDPNVKISGEVSAYLQDSKRALAKLGVHVKWNAEKKTYVVPDAPAAP
jgi:hypothetical protein